MGEYWRVLYRKLISRNVLVKSQNKCKPTSFVLYCRFCGSTWRIWAIWWVLRWLFYRSYLYRQHFRLRSFASFQLFRFLGAVGLFRSDMLLIFNMVWSWFSCGTVCVCLQFPYRRNDTIFWTFPIVPCHAFCMWHWPMGKDLDLSFIWDHHHLHIVGLWISVEQLNTSQPATTCWRDPTRSKQLSTVAIRRSVWTLSCRCPVKLST